MSYYLLYVLVSFFHLIMKLVMLLLLIFRSSTGLNVSVGTENRQEVHENLEKVRASGKEKGPI
jgi:sensor domain CHASE-containing protein